MSTELTPSDTVVMADEKTFSLREGAYTHHVIMAPGDQTMKTVLQPYYFRKKHTKIRVGDIIEVRHESRKFRVVVEVVGKCDDSETLDFEVEAGFGTADWSSEARERISCDWETAVPKDGGDRGWFVWLYGKVAGASGGKYFKSEALARNWIGLMKLNAQTK